MNLISHLTIVSHRRCLIVAGVIAIVLVSELRLEAGMLVGTGNGNDNKPNVLSVVNTYNATNDPDLPTVFELFKKTDDDSAFVFNPANDFAFFEDAAGTLPVLTEAALLTLDEAYFSYSGTASLLYYSVKGGPDFNVFTYAPGLNLIQAPPVGSGSPAEISHVSFWGNTEPPAVVPEPSTCVILAMGGIVGLLRRRR